MDYSTGKLSFILILATLFSFVVAWGLASRYRAAMRKCMSLPAETSTSASSSSPGSETLDAALKSSASHVTLADNRRAGLRLSLLLVGLSVLISISSAVLYLATSMGAAFLSPARVLTLTVVHVWPAIPLLGLLWRWSRRRILGVALIWFLVSFLLVMWRSTEQQQASVVLGFLALEIGPPMILVAALCLGNATRAIAPLLLPFFVGLVWASIAGMDLLWWLVQHQSPVLMRITSWLSANIVMALFALVPWLLAWWPLRLMCRLLARAYTLKLLSELMLLFTAVWAIALFYKALESGGELGLLAMVMLLPLAWIPLVMWLNRRLSVRHRHPPTLLVLRVFQRDAAVQTLFDRVIERWRLTGNTLLIAGTDLVERTTDAEDIFTFLDGRLATRFIRHSSDLDERLADFDLRPDDEGRYRINECYCLDSTWQMTLAALIQHSDIVLMDLRSFQKRNAGCRYELGLLAQATHLRRVVILTDDQTDLATAKASAVMEGAQEDSSRHFEWIDTTTIDRSKKRDLLERLFLEPA